MRRRRRTRCCCPCPCCSGSAAATSTIAGLETICYCSRYVDVPMSIYYGPGYTELDCCIDTRETLQEISDTLKLMTLQNTAQTRQPCCFCRCC